MYWTKPARWSRRCGYWIAKTLTERQWGESEDKLRQSVEFRCAGRIECLLGRRGLRVVGAEQRARLSEKGRDSAQHAGIERRVGRARRTRWRRNQKGHASHGFRNGTCVFAKSLTLRETTVRL